MPTYDAGVVANWLKLIFLAIGVLFVSQCAPPPPPPPRLVLTPASYAELADWRKDNQAMALAALRQTCTRFNALDDDRPVGPDALAGTIADWRPICVAAAKSEDGDDQARQFFETWFEPFLALDNENADGLFTGYYEAELHGSRTRNGPYRVPIYRRPDELVTADLGQFREEWKGKKIAGHVIDGHLRPFPTRAEIEAGALNGRALEILWVDDPIDAFFLHIQGSGRVITDDGEVVRLGYGGQNGRPYVAIGRELIDRGAIAREHMSMQAIRTWLNDHPEEAPGVMALNPSFVFFQVMDKPGPVGAQGVPLTPGRSLAVDRKFVPLGIPVWLDTTDPLAPETPLRRLVVAQDTGGAIKGPVRGDLFWGFGDAAATKAGYMKQSGRYYLLLPKCLPETAKQTRRS